MDHPANKHDEWDKEKQRKIEALKKLQVPGYKGLLRLNRKYWKSKMTHSVLMDAVYIFY